MITTLSLLPLADRQVVAAHQRAVDAYETATIRLEGRTAARAAVEGQNLSTLEQELRRRGLPL